MLKLRLAYVIILKIPSLDLLHWVRQTFHARLILLFLLFLCPKIGQVRRFTFFSLSRLRARIYFIFKIKCMVLAPLSTTFAIAILFPPNGRLESWQGCFSIAVTQVAMVVHCYKLHLLLLLSIRKLLLFVVEDVLEGSSTTIVWRVLIIVIWKANCKLIATLRTMIVRCWVVKVRIILAILHLHGLLHILQSFGALSLIPHLPQTLFLLLLRAASHVSYIR